MSTGGLTAQRYSVREIVLGKMWDYVNDNFHKFTEANKIKIAVAFLSRDIPSQIEDQSPKPETKVVIVRESNGNQSQEGNVSRPVSVIRV